MVPTPAPTTCDPGTYEVRQHTYSTATTAAAAVAVARRQPHHSASQDFFEVGGTGQGCAPCAAGKFSSQSGALVCTVCGAGKVATQPVAEQATNPGATASIRQRAYQRPTERCDGEGGQLGVQEQQYDGGRIRVNSWSSTSSRAGCEPNTGAMHRPRCGSPLAYTLAVQSCSHTGEMDELVEPNGASGCCG